MICEGKERFETDREAAGALAKCVRDRILGNPRRRELTAYECGFCEGWHLSSVPRQDGAILAARPPEARPVV